MLFQRSMKGVVALLLITVFLCAYIISTVNAIICDGVNQCGQASDRCCRDVHLGSVCFNPATHHCVTIQGTGFLKRLCGIYDKACNDFIAGKTCYDPTRYNCGSVIDNPGQRRLCPKGYRACGHQGVCFQVGKFKCCNGQVCGIGSPNCNC